MTLDKIFWFEWTAITLMTLWGWRKRWKRYWGTEADKKIHFSSKVQDHERHLLWSQSLEVDSFRIITFGFSVKSEALNFRDTVVWFKAENLAIKNFFKGCNLQEKNFHVKNHHKSVVYSNFLYNMNEIVLWKLKNT